MKGIAVPFLVAFIIGVIVLAIAILLIYYVVEGGSWDCKKCRAQFTTWCSECFVVNVNEEEWIEGTKLGEKLSNCVKECGIWTSASAESDCQGAEETCKPFNVFETG